MYQETSCGDALTREPLRPTARVKLTRSIEGDGVAVASRAKLDYNVGVFVVVLLLGEVQVRHTRPLVEGV